MPKRLTCGIVLHDPTSIWALLFENRWTNEQVMSKGGKQSQPSGWVTIEKSSVNLLLRMGCDTGRAKEQLLKMQLFSRGSKTFKAQMQSSGKSLAANETLIRKLRSAVNLQQPSTPGASVSLVTIAAARTSPSECKRSVPAADASHSMASACRSRAPGSPAPAASPSKNGGRGSGVSKVCLYLLLRLQNPNSH